MLREMLMWRIGRVPNNARRWQMGFNSLFKGSAGSIAVPLT